MIGKILGGRYRIEEKIGDGGMAVVFRGVDTLLGRSVTIKILRETLAGDQDVVRSFRREAHAAASLSHPNIVNVYDVGREEEIYYIVMEYIDGRSLKELIMAEGRLSLTQAVSIALQICEALQHAHRHNIIHRDIKPHNILITQEGRAKVADFGIARAITSATVTYTQSIVGSVHYFSPEQANGGLAAEKSDLYSLGIVLYEMLTGDVPFSGDTPVSIALKHVREEIPVPSEINPDIPPDLEEIIMKAVEKSPEDRYESAEELARDLKEFQELIGSNPNYTGERKSRHLQGRRKKNKGKNKKKLWVMVGAILFLALLIGTFFLFRSLMTVPEVPVPMVEGLTLEQAISKLQAAGLIYEVEQAPSRDVPAGNVISQDPQEGRMVRKGRMVTLILSTGPLYVTVPGVTGKTELEASIAIKAQDLTVEVEEKYSMEVDTGYVMEQYPREGHRLQKGEKVTIVVSLGGQPVKLQDFTGMTLEEARSWLNRYNLELGPVSERSSSTPKGLVIGQSPEPNEVLPMGGIVELVISTGPDPARMQKFLISIEIPEGLVPEGEKVDIIIQDAMGERKEKVEYTGEVIEVEGYEQGLIIIEYKGVELATKEFP